MKIALFSDIHANLHAFEACLRDAEYREVEQLLSLGDLIGYGPDPEEVVTLCRSVGLASVMGNHDYAVNSVAGEKWFNPLARNVVAMTRKLLSSKSLEFLSGLPRFMERRGGYLVHGFPPSSFRTYVYMVPERGIKRVLAKLGQELVFVGHTHELALYALTPGGRLNVRPLTQEIVELHPSTRYLVNAGSVGQPRDGDPRAKYLIWDVDSRTVEVRFVEYPAEIVARRILERGFPEAYAQRLFGR